MSKQNHFDSSLKPHKSCATLGQSIESVRVVVENSMANPFYEVHTHTHTHTHTPGITLNNVTLLNIF